jgi:hypothetical protein
MELEDRGTAQQRQRLTKKFAEEHLELAGNGD